MLGLSDYDTMENIATFFGSTSHKVGRILKRLGWRLDNGEPSPQAHRLGLVRQRPVYGREYYPVWLWHVEKTIPILQEAGLTLK